MCGIAGFINFDSKVKADHVLLKEMTDLITHRGPDSEGFHLYGNLGMGFRRLSIIDLNTGDQPISDASKNYTITFNGEIYNFKELRLSLSAKGYIFKTTTDTEVILNSYIEYGVECLKHLRGMFAFVIFDKTKNILFGARDRFGIKPFYYSLNSERFVWGSELKCVKKGMKKDLTLNFDSLNEYFTYGYIGQNKAIWNEISKLPPSHFFILEPDKGEKGLVINKYWKISYEPDNSVSENDWVEMLDQKFSESVKMHMISDVPLGAFLSGGIDSSGVVAFMNKVSPGNVKTFSIGFKEEKFNELQYAREVADKYKTEHHELILEPESVELLPRLVSAFDEPFADSSAIPTYYVSKFAREFVTVVLSGDGGDELFAGYNNYMKALSVKNSPFSNYMLNPLWNIIYQTMPDKVSGKGLAYFMSKNRSDLGAYFCVMKKNERSSLFNDHTLNRIGNYSSEADRIQMLNCSSSKDFVSRLEELDLLNYLPGDILTKVDRTSMQNSLETRVPILDHEFAELSFKIPSSMKMTGSEGKLVFKKMLKKYLPQNVMTHKKQGFGVPISIWFKDDLKSYMNDRLLNKKAEIYNYLNYSAVEKMISDQNFGMRDFSAKIWAVLFLEEWLKQNF